MKTDGMDTLRKTLMRTIHGLVTSASQRRALTTDAFGCRGAYDDDEETQRLYRRLSTSIEQRLHELAVIECDADWLMGASAVVGRERSSDTARMVLAALALEALTEQPMLSTVGRLIGLVEPEYMPAVLMLFRGDNRANLSRLSLMAAKTS